MGSGEEREPVVRQPVGTGEVGGCTVEVLEGVREGGQEVGWGGGWEEETSGVEGCCERASGGRVECDGEGGERVLSDVPMGRVPTVAVRGDVIMSGEVPGDPAGEVFFFGKINLWITAEKAKHTV